MKKPASKKTEGILSKKPVQKKAKMKPAPKSKPVAVYTGGLGWGRGSHSPLKEGHIRP